MTDEEIKQRIRTTIGSDISKAHIYAAGFVEGANAAIDEMKSLMVRVCLIATEIANEGKR